MRFITLALVVLMTAAIGIHFQVEREADKRNAVAESCWVPGVGGGETSTDKIKIQRCFLRKGYRFHGKLDCNVSFPSRYDAPFCYEPIDWFDRQMFWIGQEFTVFAQR